MKLMFMQQYYYYQITHITNNHTNDCQRKAAVQQQQPIYVSVLTVFLWMWKLIILFYLQNRKNGVQAKYVEKMWKLQFLWEGTTQSMQLFNLLCLTLLLFTFWEPNTRGESVVTGLTPQISVLFYYSMLHIQPSLQSLHWLIHIFLLLHLFSVWYNCTVSSVSVCVQHVSVCECVLPCWRPDSLYPGLYLWPQSRTVLCPGVEFGSGDAATGCN